MNTPALAPASHSPALAPALHTPALAPNLCIPALALDLYLLSLAQVSYTPALAPASYSPALAPVPYIPSLAPVLFNPALAPDPNLSTNLAPDDYILNHPIEISGVSGATPLPETINIEGPGMLDNAMEPVMIHPTLALLQRQGLVIVFKKSL